jgi:hypothetical protein
MNIEKILIKFIENNKFDGLVNNYAECGCGKEDLAPCGQPNLSQCKAAYKMKNTSQQNGDFDIYYTTDKQ